MKQVHGTLVYSPNYSHLVIITSACPKVVEALLHDLHWDFSLNDPGVLHYFLGKEVTPVYNGIILSQGKYIADTTRRIGMNDCKPVTTSLSTSEKLSMTEGEILGGEDSTRYKSIVGALQYPTLTRPDISS